MIPINPLSPLAGGLGTGGIGGNCVGYILKKIAKITAAILTIGFMGLQYLAFKGIIDINYSALQDWVMSILGEAVALLGVITTLLAQMPFGVGFVGGLVVGLKKRVIRHHLLARRYWQFRARFIESFCCYS